MSKELPPLNARIKKIMNDKTGKTERNVSEFARMLSEEREKEIVQQRLDKIYKGSDVATDIIEAILLRFPDIDPMWLITGKEKSGSVPDAITSQIEDEINTMRSSLEKLSKTLSKMRGSNKKGAV
ncbi:MAG TPA: hypothetical protein VD794_07415, partial [Flavisolibacter sp.]|nr:hypothetical protein [Flavisolibacter sp.]